MAANLGKTVINWEEVWENFQYSISKNTVNEISMKFLSHFLGH